MTRGRWPRWVYDSGEEPDARFSMANERTFLAWIRTSLALLAAGVAVQVVDLDVGTGTQRSLTLVFLTLGLVSAVTAWTRWARIEAAMRRRSPLPAPGATAVLTAGVLVAAAVLVVVSVR